MEVEENPYKTPPSTGPNPSPDRTRTKWRSYIPLVFALLGAVAAGVNTGNWRVATLLGGAVSGTAIGFLLASLFRALR